VIDELAIAARFEQVFRSFRADTRTTLAVVCFPLGTWVGGLYTAACLRHLNAEGYAVTVVAPGNNKGEILRVIGELAPNFDQAVLLGYPPFVKDVIDSGIAAGLDWHAHAVKLVFAGEVFSEEWRSLVGQRAGVADPVRDTAALYGTTDAGVLGNGTRYRSRSGHSWPETPARQWIYSVSPGYPPWSSTTRAAGTSKPTTAHCCSPATTGSRWCATT
jgi:phenylacetate-CoA ligase